MRKHEIRDSFEWTLQHYSFGRGINRKRLNTVATLRNINIVSWYIDKYYPTRRMLSTLVMNPLFDMLNYIPAKSLLYTKKDLRLSGLVKDRDPRMLDIVLGDKFLDREFIKNMKQVLWYPDVITMMMLSGHGIIEQYIKDNIHKINKILYIK